MLSEIIYLKDVFHNVEMPGCNPRLEVYIAKNKSLIGNMNSDFRPAIIICPGGGYSHTSEREAEPVALSFLNEGYNVIVLRYSVSPHKYPVQLLELSATVAYTRRMADKWKIDKDKIVVCGFSAGGHLAASIGSMWHEEFILQKLSIKEGENRPNALVLSYPVITSNNEYSHRGSFECLLGKNATKEQLEYVSLENRVTEKVPPTFIWHTYTDTTVPVENSLFFAKALKEKNVSFEMHIYSNGPHGLSLCNENSASEPEHINPQAGTWFGLCINWLNKAISKK
jgi:acetyl esterase/lipase